MDPRELENWFGWGGEREDDDGVLGTFLHLYNWMLMLLSDTKSTGLLCVLEESLDLK